MKRLNDELAGMGAALDCQLTLFESGAAMLDVRRNGRAFVMAYSPNRGFGVDHLAGGEGLGNHYGFTCVDFDSAARELRTLADVASRADGPALSLLVIQARNLESAKAFYDLVGLSFRAEQHGSGAPHYSAALGPLTLEIYPCQSDRSHLPLRIGFQVPNVDEKLELLRRHGAKVVSEPKDSPWGRRAVVEDPDGNRVELVSSK
jgi:predicted enzyme related to lactoylglutathione lyase